MLIGPLVQRGLCPKGGGGLYRQAGDNNPSGTCGATSLCTREALFRTVGDAGPYGCHSFVARKAILKSPT